MSPVDRRRTARLLLVRVEPDDFGDLLAMHRDARVMATLGGVRNDTMTRDLLEGALAHWERYGFGLWTLRDPATRRFVGRGGLHHVTIDGRDEIEVAYALMAEFWGRGLATEVARESVALAFGELRIPELVCFTLTTNHASRRVMEKAGFRYERDITWAGEPHLLHRLPAAAWRVR